MKLVPNTLGTALAGIALLATIAWATQDGSKPQNQPKLKPAASAPQNAPKKAQVATAPPHQEPAGDMAKADADGHPTRADADAAFAARYAKAAAVGDEQKWLAGFVGKWKTVTRQTLKPGTPPIESAGSSEFKMFMDGRFLVESNNSAGGVGNCSGMGVIGFNNLTGKYERVWFDSHSTAMVKSEGSFTKGRDEIRWVDQFTDPGLGKVIATTSSLRRLSDKEMAF
ncbi:MAG TPA: DUF1579 family protein, partial [Planctomycetota bacterium]|nr:DUF1579 family protein [Planctomycetota bacterium]